MRGFIAASLLLGACGSPHVDGSITDAGTDTSTADAVRADARVDPPAMYPLYATSRQMLHRIDLDHRQATLIGPIQESGGATIDVAGLAFDGTRLLGLTPNGGAMVRINPDTGLLVSKKNLTPVGHWTGLTVVPAGELGSTAIVFTGSNDAGQLYRISVGDGTITAVGPFLHDLSFFSDLAWVHGRGLFATLQGAECEPVCLARIDPMTGEATIVRANLPNTIFALSGYRDRLWAFNGNGPVLAVNMTSWLMTIELDTQIHWTEAAQ